MLLKVGELLNQRYKIEKALGQGGMAEVYRAWDNLRNHSVAIKVLHPHLANDPHIAERFQFEAKTLQELSHDHIVRFYGFEQAGDLSFLVMEFVPGSTLDDRLPISNLAEIKRITIDICRALSYAHKLGVIHRDVKPGNILFNQNGDVKVSDFGIAKVVGGLSMTMGYIGTQYYMSPEQIRMEKLDQRSDIYAFGVMLYEMATVVKPFRGDRIDPGTDVPSPVLWEQLNLPPIPPIEVRPGLDLQLQSIILKCLEKHPAQRFQNFDQVSMAIQAMGGVQSSTIVDEGTFLGSSIYMAKDEAIFAGFT